VAVPVLRYSFGIINWRQEEIQKPERKARKMLTIHGQYHPGADTDRFIRSQKIWRKRNVADRGSLYSKSYETDGICRK